MCTENQPEDSLKNSVCRSLGSLNQSTVKKKGSGYETGEGGQKRRRRSFRRDKWVREETGTNQAEEIGRLEDQIQRWMDVGWLLGF